MPELPEVETTVKGLSVILNQKISNVKIHTSKLRFKIPNNIINKITFKWKMKYKIILTGGYAFFFKKIIKKKTIVDQDITIKGISKVYKDLI